MKESFVIKLLDRFSFAFKSFGVDYPMMRRILKLKLIMDKRRVPTIMANNKNSQGKSSYKATIFMYLFMGLFISMFIFVPYPLFVKMNMILGIILFMIMTTMISDFSAVLLDLRDKNILLTRPVDAKTLNAAKLVHIVVYLSGITAAIAGIPLIAGTIRYGAVFFVIFLAELIFVCGFTILFTSILYFLILQFFSGEKLKDIINYFQIALSVFIVVAYQLIGRLYSFADMKITVRPQWWNVALPSAWFAAPFTLFIDHNFNIIYIVLGIASFVIPVAAMVVYIKAAAPAFERNLQKLSNSDGGFKRTVKKNSLQRAVSNLVCKSKDEKVFFNFTSFMLKSERKLKLKMYPNMAFAFIFPFIFLITFVNNSKSFADGYSMVSHAKYYIFLYFSLAMISPLCLMLGMSENYKGAWIYSALPIKQAAPVLKGAVKSFIFRFIAPFFVVWGVILTVVYGPAVIPHFIFIIINSLILFMISFMVNKKELPFCKDFDFTQGGKSVGMAFFLLFICGLFAVFHYLVARFFAPGIYICIPASLFAFLLLWHFAFKISWKELKAAE